jgi:amidase
MLGSILFVNPVALAEAAASDRVRQETGARSPLERIPVLLEDNVDTADMPTTAGSAPGSAVAPTTRRSPASSARPARSDFCTANLSEWAGIRAPRVAWGNLQARAPDAVPIAATAD